MSEPTPRPWTLNYLTIDGEPFAYHIAGAKHGSSLPVIEYTDGSDRRLNDQEQADLELIVRAVNAHDELVEALSGLVAYVYATTTPDGRPSDWERGARVLRALGRMA